MNKNKTLLQKFIEFNSAKRLASAKKKTLLAISGGTDSVVMCDLFHRAGYPFAMAHCNFQLRGKESDADEEFVKQLGQTYKVRAFTHRFETEKYAGEKGLSIQLAARELRYEWFEKLRATENYRLIATAHHLNDNIETIIYNFIKGTGIRGLRGIPVRQGNIIRPLLFASREEIEGYLNEHQLRHREDSSNASDKYTRNKIRHHLIPLMKEINPSLENTLAEKINILTELEQLYEKRNVRAAAQLFKPVRNDVYISILKLKKTPNAATVLFEYLKMYDFNGAQVDDILASLNATSGKQFITSKARIIKDRKFLILTKLPETDFTVQLINEGSAEINLDGKKLKLSTLDSKDSPIKPAKHIAWINKAELSFPLVARRWKPGDYFYPLGMGMKKKKLKKFFVDEKIPVNEKENSWVIESGQRIVWVVGHRLDERFKVTPSTTEILELRLV